jgi:hypothetical protein
MGATPNCSCWRSALHWIQELGSHYWARAVLRDSGELLFLQGGVEMPVLDITAVLVLIVLTVLRIGMPLFGMCLLCQGLKRLLPAQV